MYIYILMILMGICFIILGIINYKGNINTIHFYNRQRITEENHKPYSMLMGFGTSLIGLGLIATGICQLIWETEKLYYILFASVFIAMIIMLYAQMRYNKGIF